MSAEGPMAFYKGFFPIWGRFAPATVIMFVVFEKYTEFNSAFHTISGVDKLFAKVRATTDQSGKCL